MTKTNNKVEHTTHNIMYFRVLGRNIHLFHLVLIGFALFSVIYISSGSVLSAYIAKNGIMEKGIITDIIISGSKGVRDYHYRFNYNGIVYSNSTIHLSKSIGDSVNVIFIKEDPSKNRLEERLVNTYGFFLKRNPHLTQK